MIIYSHAADRIWRDDLKNHQSWKLHRRRSVRFVSLLVKIPIESSPPLRFCRWTTQMKNNADLHLLSFFADLHCSVGQIRFIPKSLILHKSLPRSPLKIGSEYWLPNPPAESIRGPGPRDRAHISVSIYKASGLPIQPRIWVGYENTGGVSNFIIE